jgi:hypothetical protein
MSFSVFRIGQCRFGIGLKQPDGGWQEHSADDGFVYDAYPGMPKQADPAGAIQ